MPQTNPAESKGKLSSALCFLFGHVYYQKVFTGKFIHVGRQVATPVPEFEIKKTEFCSRCGKQFAVRKRQTKL